MQEKVHKLTPEGKKSLEKKLRHLKKEVRQEIAERIRQAKEFGEISENSEYENAKSEQARIEQEIMKLENILRNAEVIEKKDEEISCVEVGVTVVLNYLEDDKMLTFEIVGTTETDPTHTPPRISDESPLGKALIENKAEKGQIVELEVPIGKASYRVLDILYSA